MRPSLPLIPPFSTFMRMNPPPRFVGYEPPSQVINRTTPIPNNLPPTPQIKPLPKPPTPAQYRLFPTPGNTAQNGQGQPQGQGQAKGQSGGVPAPMVAWCDHLSMV